MNAHTAPEVRNTGMCWLALSVACALIAPMRSAVCEDGIHPVPRASCGPQDHTESGVQGQTTLAERFVSGPTRAYNCNLELVGRFDGEGSGADVEDFENCAYYSTGKNAQLRHPGVTVLDVSDSHQPKVTAYLDSPAMIDAHESLEVHAARKLLIGSRPESTFDLYDLSDCRHPQLRSSVAFPGLFSHAGQFTADGNTFYGATWPPTAKSKTDSAVFALDVRDPTKPRLLGMWKPPQKEWITHSASVNKGGTRAYVSLKRMTDETVKGAGPNGLVILDVSDFQSQRANPQFRLISTLFWNDSHGSEGITPVRIRARPYLIFTDNLGTLAAVGTCDPNKPVHGFARIIDISDEARPRTASRLMLQSADPANCTNVRYDQPVGGYGSFGCGVDDVDNAKLAACGYFEAGLRVFDIRDPVRPREVAYYKPPALRTSSRPGSLFRSLVPKDKPAPDYTADALIMAPKFRPNGEIWLTSADNGFQVVRFSDDFIARHKDLFAK